MKEPINYANNSPAFPSQPLNQQGLPEQELQEGMTLLQYMATKAMQGICANSNGFRSAEGIATEAVAVAKALAEELTK